MNLRFIVRTFWASMIASLKMVIRYVTLRGLIAFNISVPLFFVLTSWVVGQVMTGGTGYSEYLKEVWGTGHYLTFTLIGFAFNTFIFSAAFGGAHALRGEQEHGTAELVFVTPANKIAWLLGKVMGNIFFSLIGFSLVLFSGFLIFGFQTDAFPNFPLAALSILLTIVSLTAFGLVFAGVCFMAKREHELSQVLWPSMVFLCGLAFPVEVLPPPLPTISWLIPVTYGIDLTRKALIFGSGILEPLILYEIGVLVLQTVIMLPIGLVLYSWLEKKAKKTGALATY